MNGAEFLEVHQNKIMNEIREVIKEINANNFKTKVSKEKTMTGKELFNPVELNKAFKEAFEKRGWEESRYAYCVTTNREDVENTQNMSLV